MGLLSSTLEVDELMGSLSRCGLDCFYFLIQRPKSMGTLCSTPVIYVHEYSTGISFRTNFGRLSSTYVCSAACWSGFSPPFVFCSFRCHMDTLSSQAAGSCPHGQPQQAWPSSAGFEVGLVLFPKNDEQFDPKAGDVLLGKLSRWALKPVGVDRKAYGCPCLHTRCHRPCEQQVSSQPIDRGDTAPL